MLLISTRNIKNTPKASIKTLVSAAVKVALLILAEDATSLNTAHLLRFQTAQIASWTCYTELFSGRTKRLVLLLASSAVNVIFFSCIFERNAILIACGQIRGVRMHMHQLGTFYSSISVFLSNSSICRGTAGTYQVELYIKCVTCGRPGV